MKANAVQNPRIERANAAPSDFAARFPERQGLELIVEMAHDMRSPLTSIMFLAETLQLGQSGPINDVQRRQLGLIRSAALCLCGAASDVLELSRGGDSLTDLEPAPFSISDVFRSVRDLARPLAEEKGLDLRFLAPELEERIGHDRAVARVLLNLTTNALKFTDRGFVEVAARETGHTRIEFSVRDTGPGIDSESVGALYEPFRTGPTGGRGARQQFSSSGLGLAICRKLVAAMGSQLDLKTRPGSGTKFTFALELPPVLTCVAR
jgi:signal transduction histidine kinase